MTSFYRWTVPFTELHTPNTRTFSNSAEIVFILCGQNKITRYLYGWIKKCILCIFFCFSWVLTNINLGVISTAAFWSWNIEHTFRPAQRDIILWDEKNWKISNGMYNFSCAANKFSEHSFFEFRKVIKNSVITIVTCREHYCAYISCKWTAFFQYFSFVSYLI